ncbi:4471_t:CDS:2, partial [Ambispora gerdemannii]
TSKHSKSSSKKLFSKEKEISSNEVSTSSTSETRHTSAATGRKRFLPPRKFGPLAGVVSSDSLLEDDSNTFYLSSEDFILITNKESDLQGCESIDEANSMMEIEQSTNEVSEPLFKTFAEDLESGLRSKTQEEEILPEKYEKRHRKFELSEKKLKNRERERLTYERYQQQLAVEKLRNMEMNRLIPIAALRTESSTTIDANDIEIMHKKLLREAEDTLKRYDELGLGGKKRKPDFPTSSGETTESEATKSPEGVVNTKKQKQRRKDKTSSKKLKLKIPSNKYKNIDDDSSKQSRNSISTSALSNIPEYEIDIIDIGESTGITTFIKPNTPMPTGYRKSTRSALAFGTKLPVALSKKHNFELPEEEFGGLLRQREEYRAANPDT